MLGVKDLGERSARPPVMCECNLQILSTGTLGLLRQKILDSELRSSGNGAGVFRCGCKAGWSHKCDPPFIFCRVFRIARQRTCQHLYNHPAKCQLN